MPSVRVLRGVRLALVAAIVVWLFSPTWIHSAIPLWLPFVVAVVLEAQFVISNYRSTRPFFTPAGRAPDAGDQERYGSGDLQDWAIVEHEGERVWVDLAEQPEDDDLPPEATDSAPPSVGSAGRGRRLARSLAEAAAVLAVIAGIAVLLDRGSWDDVSRADQRAAERRFSEEASLVAGKRVDVACDTSRRLVGTVQHADGVAVVGGTQAYITPELCNALYRLAFEDDVPSFSETARAIAVLSHEAWHLRGIRHEGVAECYAVQSGVGVGRRLGLDENDARRMMRSQLVANQQHGRSTYEYLVPRGCINRGRYDLDPAGDRFP